MAGCPAHRQLRAWAGGCTAGGGGVQMGAGRAVVAAQICSASSGVPTTGARHCVPAMGFTCSEAASAPQTSAAVWSASSNSSRLHSVQDAVDGPWPVSCVATPHTTPPTQPHPVRRRIQTRCSSQPASENWPPGTCQGSAHPQQQQSISAHHSDARSCTGPHQQENAWLPAVLHPRRRPHVLCTSVTTQERQSQLQPPESGVSIRPGDHNSQPTTSSGGGKGSRSRHAREAGQGTDSTRAAAAGSHSTPVELQPPNASHDPGSSHSSSMPNGNSQILDASSRQVYVAGQRAQQSPVSQTDNLQASSEVQQLQQTSSEPFFVTQSEEADEALSIPVLGPRTPRRGKLKRPQRPTTPPASPPPTPSGSTAWEPQPLQPALPAGEPTGFASPEPSDPQLRRRLFGPGHDNSQGATPATDSWGGPGEGQGDDDHQAYSDQSNRSTRQLRVPIAVPMQLVPLTPQYDLLHPDTGAPMSVAGSQPDDSSLQGGDNQAVSLPLQGPWLLTNHLPAFPCSDAHVDYHAAVNPDVPLRLGIRLEYIAQRDQDVDLASLQSQEAGQISLDGGLSNGSSSSIGFTGTDVTPPAATLQLFNLSRRRRGYEALSKVVVSRVVAPAVAHQQEEQEEEQEGGQQADVPVSGRKGIREVFKDGYQHFILESGNAGFELQPGDIVTLGKLQGAPKFRVELQQGQPRSSSDLLNDAVQQYCSSSSSTASLTPGKSSSARAGVPAGNRRLAGGAALAELAAAAEAGQLLELQQIGQLARVNQHHAAADAAYKTAVSGPHRHNPFAWIAWAQLNVRRRRLKQARDLFRAAVAAAAPADLPAGLSDLEDDVHVGSSSNLQPADTLSGTQSSHSHSGVMIGLGPSTLGSSTAPAEQSSNTGYGQPVPVFHAAESNVGLVQALYQWGRFEWDVARLRGSARHLWRTAADAAMLHPDGPTAGGLGVVLHTWALSELDNMNIINARVVVAEALAKCPYDQPLWVLAANVELKGGNHDVARTFCLRAYELDRTDKHLYLVWPSVMAALGERDKARVLFERGRDYHPNNTKIMNAYAEFLAESNDIEGKAAAAELHELALSIDPHSWTTMHNRAAWAQLEMDVGHYETARKLLMEGLSHHPQHLPSLLALTRLHRELQNYAEAQRVLHTAQQLTHSFDLQYQQERVELLKALGEQAMARTLKAHMNSVSSWQASKRGFLNTGPAWQLYQESTRSKSRQQLAVAALQRKRELGWLLEGGVVGPKGARQAKEGQPAVPWVPLPSPVPPRLEANQPEDTSDDSQDEGESPVESGYDEVVLGMRDLQDSDAGKEHMNEDVKEGWKDQWR